MRLSVRRHSGPVSLVGRFPNRNPSELMLDFGNTATLKCSASPVVGIASESSFKAVRKVVYLDNDFNLCELVDVPEAALKQETEEPLLLRGFTKLVEHQPNRKLRIGVSGDYLAAGHVCIFKFATKQDGVLIGCVKAYRDGADTVTVMWTNRKGIVQEATLDCRLLYFASDMPK